MKFSASRFIAPSLLATTIVTLLTQQAIAASNAPQADEVITVTTTAHNTRSAPASIYPAGAPRNSATTAT